MHAGELADVIEEFRDESVFQVFSVITGQCFPVMNNNFFDVRISGDEASDGVTNVGSDEVQVVVAVAVEVLNNSVVVE